MGKEIELRRHTDADEDFLTAGGVAAALAMGARFRGGYHLAVSTGAQRATQTLACFLAALGQQVPGGVVIEPGLRSQVEDRWRAAHQEAGSGALGALREADPELVSEDSERLGAALRRVLDALPDGGRALVVGHSPTNEAAVLGLTGEIVAPLAKGAGVRVVAGDDGYQVEPLEQQALETHLCEELAAAFAEAFQPSFEIQCVPTHAQLGEPPLPRVTERLDDGAILSGDSDPYAGSVTQARVMKRIVNERGDLVEMELPPDVFAAVAWWHEPRSWYGPVTQEQRRPAAGARDPDPDAVCLDRLADEPVEHEIINNQGQ